LIIAKNRNATIIGWGAVISWFCASILSQAAFIGTHGVPYEAEAMLGALGPWSWILVTIELGVWLMVGTLVFQKLNIKQRFRPQMT